MVKTEFVKLYLARELEKDIDWLGLTDLTSGHDGEKDGKFCDNRVIGCDCMRPGRRCGTCPERER